MGKQTFSTPIGEVAWANVVEPKQNKFNATDYNWDIALMFPDHVAQKVIEKVMEEIDAAVKERIVTEQDVARDSFKMPYGPSLKQDENGNKVPNEGYTTIRFKRKTKVLNRRTNEYDAKDPATFFDATPTKIAPIELGFGSKVKVFFRPYCYNKGAQGIALSLEAIQIQELKQKAGGFEIESLEGGYVAEQAADEVLINALKD